MKTPKIILFFAFLSFMTFSCKNEVKKEDNVTKTEVNQEIAKADFTISGMTCEIGCAKTIASKLSKKEGVIEANVAFKDSIATIKYDPSKTNKEDLMAFIDDIADGETYKACELKGKKPCSADSKKECCSKEGKKECSKNKEECKKECSKEGKEGCSKNKEECKKECSKEGKEGCSKNKEECKKECSKEEKKECDKNKTK